MWGSRHAPSVGVTPEEAHDTHRTNEWRNTLASIEGFHYDTTLPPVGGYAPPLQLRILRKTVRMSERATSRMRLASTEHEED